MPDHKRPIPRLRFPEFRDVEPWEMQRLGEVITLEYGSSLPETQRNKGRYPVVGSNGVVGFHDQALVAGPAIVVGRKGSAGQVSWIKSACYPIDTTYYVKLRSKGDKLPFVRRLLEQHRLAELASSGGVPGLNRDDVYVIKTAIPSGPEQQKIADCLGSLDDLIRAEEAVLEALRAHKTGLMQQLFPRAGETTPRLRFPEFRDAGPWEAKRLGNKGIAEFVRKRVAPEDIPLGHYVSTVNLLPDFGGLSPTPEAPPPNSAIAYREGDILMSNIRPYLKKIWIADRSGGASNDVLVARPEKNIVCGFLGQFLMSDRFIVHVMDGAKGVKMPRGDLEKIRDFEVPLPQKSEQQKIADCLGSLDELIRAREGWLGALRDHKIGLMQQLFPQEVG